MDKSLEELAKARSDQLKEMGNGSTMDLCPRIGHVCPRTKWKKPKGQAFHPQLTRLDEVGLCLICPMCGDWCGETHKHVRQHCKPRMAADRIFFGFAFLKEANPDKECPIITSTTVKAMMTLGLSPDIVLAQSGNWTPDMTMWIRGADGKPKSLPSPMKVCGDVKSCHKVKPTGSDMGAKTQSKTGTEGPEHFGAHLIAARSKQVASLKEKLEKKKAELGKMKFTFKEEHNAVHADMDALEAESKTKLAALKAKKKELEKKQQEVEDEQKTLAPELAELEKLQDDPNEEEEEQKAAAGFASLEEAVLGSKRTLENVDACSNKKKCLGQCLAIVEDLLNSSQEPRTVSPPPRSPPTPRSPPAIRNTAKKEGATTTQGATTTRSQARSAQMSCSGSPTTRSQAAAASRGGGKTS